VRELRWFLAYAVIGATGVAVFVGAAALLVRAGCDPLLATALGMLLGASLQFALNRHVNFRAIHQPVARQALTFATVMAVNIVATLAIVAAALHTLHASPVVANILSVPITFPLAYVVNRHLTFGPGMRI